MSHFDLNDDDLEKIKRLFTSGVMIDSSYLNDTYGFTTASSDQTYATGARSLELPQKVYLGMYVYVEEWPEVEHHEKSVRKVCITVNCPYYLDVILQDPYRDRCVKCGQPLSHYAVEDKRSILMDELIHKPLGARYFRTVMSKNKKVIVPYPEHAHELGGTIIEDNLTPLKGIIDYLKRSEIVHEYWYVLCASLQRHGAKFQPGRGLVII